MKLGIFTSRLCTDGKKCRKKKTIRFTYKVVDLLLKVARYSFSGSIPPMLSACYPYVTLMYRVNQSDPRVNSYVTSTFYACTRVLF